MNVRTILLPLVLCAAIFAGCTENTTSPTVNLGKTTLDDFRQNTAYEAWYSTGYAAYPAVEDSVYFNNAVNEIASKLTTESDYTVVMVVKPNCGCQHTQREMPRVMKTLDAAGFPHDRIEIWITDAALNGIDELKSKVDIDIAPTFLIMKGDTEAGRIEVDEATNGAEISLEMASIFDK